MSENIKMFSFPQIGVIKKEAEYPDFQQQKKAMHLHRLAPENH